MSAGFVVSLAVVAAALLGARFLIAAFPLRNVAVRMTVADAILAGAGLLGLGFHCGAMFFRSGIAALPGANAVAGEISALGTVSIIWYVVPGALVLLGLRRQYPLALAAVALALAAVGVTMYDGGSLQEHLSAILISVVILAAVSAILVLPPGSGIPQPRNADHREWRHARRSSFSSGRARRGVSHSSCQDVRLVQ